MNFTREDVLTMVDALFHEFASTYRVEAKRSVSSMMDKREYSEEAQELAFAWESTGTPLEAIAEMHIKMQNKIKELNRKDK